MEGDPPADVAGTTDYPFLGPLGLAGRGGTTDSVQAALREAIVASDLPPGASINKHAICERLGVSRFPVSEALARLQAEGLVEILPQRGTRVTRIRLRDVREAMFIRRALETEGVRVLAGRLGAERRAEIDRNLRYQETAVAAQDHRGFHRLDLEFHALLIDALGFPRVPGLVETARGGLERVRRMLSTASRLPEVLHEHAAIWTALTAGDGAAAAAAMRRHLDRVVDDLVRFGERHPGVVDPD
ncbi:GntR family transcriptional regulator [Prosthecomicrobium sp. N25]|uniref:GntR family transcriptional regulator n=1 Tax=Prosthecomicrobium sp. N25 TaxID=3129254 RepID=UPI003077C48C